MRAAKTLLNWRCWFGTLFVAMGASICMEATGSAILCILFGILVIAFGLWHEAVFED